MVVVPGETTHFKRFNIIDWFYRDLSGQGEIQNVILDSFSSPNEEVKSAASYALGRCLFDRKQYPDRSKIFGCVHFCCGQYFAVKKGRNG